MPRQRQTEDMAVSESDAQLITSRIAARGLAKRLRKRSEAGDLTCPTCQSPMAFDDTVVLLMECGHEVLAVPCAEHGFALFEPAGSHGHRPDAGVPVPLARWLQL